MSRTRDKLLRSVAFDLALGCFEADSVDKARLAFRRANSGDLIAVACPLCGEDVTTKRHCWARSLVARHIEVAHLGVVPHRTVAALRSLIVIGADPVEAFSQLCGKAAP